MSQKPTKPLTPSHSTMKNTVFNFEDLPINYSSQPISTDSPFPQRDLESRSNSMRLNNAKKNRGGKLTLLLDNTQPSRVSIFTKTNKSTMNMTSLSPGRRGFKSNKASDLEKGGRSKESSIHKSYMRMDSDKEQQFKATLKLNSTDAAVDVYNKETQRPRKHKKGHKLSSGCKDNLLQGQSFNQTSFNMSHLSDTSCLISGLTNIALQNNSNVPYNSPKQTLFTTVQSQIIDFSSVTPPKVSLKAKKNSSIDKAHLVYSATTQNGLPYHRKTEAISNNPNESKALGKSFSKLEQRRSCVSHASPKNNNTSGISGLQRIKRSTSRDTKAGRNKLSELRSKFDAMIGNYDTQIAGALESKNILRNMKQEYEAIIESLLKSKDKDSSVENNKLREENTRLKIEMAEIKSEQEKLQLFIKNMKDTRGNSPCQSGIPTEKRGPNGKSTDSPPLTQSSKNTSKGDKETERLNQILMRQQGTITTLRKKEAKMMKLIYAIRKQGVDIEKIYDEEVKEKYGGYCVPTLNKLDMVQVEADENTTERCATEKQESIMEGSEGDASVDYDAIDLDNMGKGDAKLNSAMKNKLKLDFTALKKPEGNHNAKNSNGEPVGFHEEFMSKFEEFSLSWRQESMLQKNP